MSNEATRQHGLRHGEVSRVLPWWAGGLAIGVVLILTVALVQPIGVSTQYVVAVGVLLHEFIPAVIDQSPYVVEATEGWTRLTYEFMFVSGVPLDAFVAALATGRLRWRVVPGEWEARFGSLIFGFLYPDLEASLLSIGRFGPVTLHQALAVHGIVIAMPLSALCLWAAMRLPDPRGVS